MWLTPAWKVWPRDPRSCGVLLPCTRRHRKIDKPKPATTKSQPQETPNPKLQNSEPSALQVPMPLSGAALQPAETAPQPAAERKKQGPRKKTKNNSPPPAHLCEILFRDKKGSCIALLGSFMQVLLRDKKRSGAGFLCTYASVLTWHCAVRYLFVFACCPIQILWHKPDINRMLLQYVL